MLVSACISRGFMNSVASLRISPPYGEVKSQLIFTNGTGRDSLT